MCETNCTERRLSTDCELLRERILKRWEKLNFNMSCTHTHRCTTDRRAHMCMHVCSNGTFPERHLFFSFLLHTRAPICIHLQFYLYHLHSSLTSDTTFVRVQFDELFRFLRTFSFIFQKGKKARFASVRRAFTNKKQFVRLTKTKWI